VLKHLKSTELDEKIQRLNESPTNSTSSVYSVDNDGYRFGGVDEYDPERVFYPDVDGNWPAGIPGTSGDFSYTRPAGFWDRGPGTSPAVQTSVDISSNFTTVSGVNGTNTDAFIRPGDGFVKADLPPGTRNFILGPLVDGYVLNHGVSTISPEGSDYTNIGYIQKDTRQFILLGRIKGSWSSSVAPDPVNIGFGLYTPYIWKGTANEFTSFNPSFTLEHALWFRDKILKGKFTESVPYKYSGGVPQPDNPDNPGFKDGIVPDDGRRGGSNDNQGSRQRPPIMGGPDPNLPPGIANPEIAANYNLYNWILKTYGMGAAEWYLNNPGKPHYMNPFLPGGAYVPLASGSASGDDKISQYTYPADDPIDKLLKDIDKANKKLQNQPSKDYPYYGRPGSGMGDRWKASSSTNQYAHYDPQGQLLSESHQKILREIKKPVVVKEPPAQKLKKYRPNFAGKYNAQNTPDVTASPKSDEMVKAKNAAGQTWRTYDKHWTRYESTERLNIIYDHVGHGLQYWDKIVDKNQINKVNRDREVQEQLNIIAHEKAMLRENPQYESPFQKALKEQETLQADKDPLFKRVSNKLKPVIDYPDKPSKAGYPDEPPPEMINGWHPEYGQDRGYYNKLDPHSAGSMPTTGNVEIDAKVRRAKTLKKVLGKRA